MRFLLPDQLGNNKHPQMFHSSGFAIAAGVVAVGAAAASAAVSMSAADRARRAQGAASGQLRNALGQVQAPVYDVGSMIADASRISKAQRTELEKFMPGAAAQRAKSSQVISSMLQGDIPQDVREQTMRNIAEFGGAGFNPETAGQAGGFQAAQALVPRQFGLTSLDLQTRGMGLAQSWQQLAKAFTADPLAVGELQYRYQMGAAEVGLAKATGVYNANKDAIAASYAAQQATAQGISQIGQATSGALMGYSGALGQQQIAASAGGANYGALSNQTLYATPQMSQQYSSGTMPSISNRPVAIPQSQPTSIQSQYKPAF